MALSLIIPTYNRLKEMEDQRYYRVNRFNLFRSIFKGFWRGFKKFFSDLNHIKSKTIKEVRYFNPILDNRLLTRDFIGIKAK